MASNERVLIKALAALPVIVHNNIYIQQTTNDCTSVTYIKIYESTDCTCNVYFMELVEMLTSSFLDGAATVNPLYSDNPCLRAVSRRLVCDLFSSVQCPPA